MISTFVSSSPLFTSSSTCSSFLCSCPREATSPCTCPQIHPNTSTVDSSLRPGDRTQISCHIPSCYLKYSLRPSFRHPQLSAGLFPTLHRLVSPSTEGQTKKREPSTALHLTHSPPPFHPRLTYHTVPQIAVSEPATGICYPRARIVAYLAGQRGCLPIPTGIEIYSPVRRAVLVELE